MRNGRDKDLIEGNWPNTALEFGEGTLVCTFHGKDSKDYDSGEQGENCRPCGES